MIAGGPIASLVWVAITAMARAGSPSLWVRMSLAAALTTAILPCWPNTQHTSDGTRLWMLLRHPAQSLSWISSLALVRQDMLGIRPRDWDTTLVSQLLAAPPPGAGSSMVAYLAFCRAKDQHRDEDALVHLEHALATCGDAAPTLRQTLFFEAACVSALDRGNAAQARSWLKRGIALGKPETLAAVEAAIAMCEKRYDEALAQWAAAREFVARRGLDSGFTRASLDAWSRSEEECRAVPLT